MSEHSIFTDDLASGLPEALERVDARRVLVIVSPSRRFLDRLEAVVGDRDIEVFDGARVHVPAELVADASKVMKRFEADCIVALGGGSAIGLGKALRLEHDATLVAVPTTYSGSEQTDIYGIRTGDEKKTGRDPRVRPDVVVYAASLTVGMPKKRSAQSLLNALAHPISALWERSLEGEVRADALDAIRLAVAALEELAEAPDNITARAAALRASAKTASIIHRGKLGAHHRIAHFLGGRFDLDHAGLHSALLPHSVATIAEEAPALFAEIADAAGVPDLPGALFDLLRRAGAPESIGALGVERDAFERALEERPDLPAALMQRAFHGGRPSMRVCHADWELELPVRIAGPRFTDARAVVVALHGRGSNANDFVKRLFEVTGDAPDLSVVAPQAPGNAWYDKSYKASLAEHGDQLTGALGAVDLIVKRILEDVDASKIFLVGFSQGACLATEYMARRKRRLGGLIALSGARIGPAGEQQEASCAFDSMPVLLGASQNDPWVPMSDIEHAASFFRDAGADVELVSTPGDGHELAGVHRIRARELLLGRSVREGTWGFGAHASEAFDGTLPRKQNSPRHVAHGLYAEQVNATGFAARRHENQRAWLYRIRPSAQHGRLEPLEHPTFVADHETTDPNLLGWAPRPIPVAPTDFVDGMATFGGAGSAELRRGFAIHLYVANRSMENRTFYDADGELLIVPQEGRLTLMTELGVLDVAPGEIAIVPRGMKFSVLLRDARARGYVGEVYGRSFHLPERGPVGANGLTDPRHFRAPEAYHEDRVAPGYRVTAKLRGRLFEGTQDHSPYDVVAWHGNYVPHVYDLTCFSPVMNARVDHPDPSIYSVLSAPLDEQGANSLDFVFFPPRVDATVGTFRPPFFHRNAVTEFNGIIRDPKGDRAPFYAGGCFLTPAMTAHGVRRDGVERALAMSDEQADAPDRYTDSSMWFQFETALPISLSRWAVENESRIRDWHHIWGAYRTHYRPPQGQPRNDEE